MSNPVIIQVIGMPGAGKTLVSRLATIQFKRLNLEVATLDVDRFARVFLEDLLSQSVRAVTLYEHITYSVAKLKNKASRVMSAGEAAALDPRVKEAVKAWIEQQEVDVIILEMRWPHAVMHYPYHELWLVTAPPDKCIKQLLSMHKNPSERMILQAKASFYQGQNRWLKTYQALPCEKHHISNAPYGRNALRYRIAQLTPIIAGCYEDGRYEDEDDRTMRSPLPLLT